MSIFKSLKGAVVGSVASAVASSVGKIVSDVAGRKIEKSEKKGEQEENVAKSIGQYAKSNSETYLSVIGKLFQETNALIAESDEMRKQKLRFSERRELSTKDAQVMENLKYLYLSKEYLSLLDKALNGVSLSDIQTVFIVRFSPFFDGRKVLNESYEEEETDNSFFSAFKGTKKEKLAREFDFDTVLSVYSKDIRARKVPDFEDVVKRFSKIEEAPAQAEPEPRQAPREEKGETCPNCGGSVPSGSKFCPSCGAPIVRDRYCSQCGAKLAPGAKFCSSCGAKAE